MSVSKTLLIECRACGIENLLADTTSGSAICNQCREHLINSDLIDSHIGHRCDDCGMAFLLKKNSGFVLGESECQCGSNNFSPLEVGNFVSDLQLSGLEDDNEIGNDFDWCRPAPNEELEDDYNNIFDDDPGFAK